MQPCWGLSPRGPSPRRSPWTSVRSKQWPVRYSGWLCASRSRLRQTWRAPWRPPQQHYDHRRQQHQHLYQLPQCSGQQRRDVGRRAGLLAGAGQQSPDATSLGVASCVPHARPDSGCSGTGKPRQDGPGFHSPAGRSHRYDLGWKPVFLSASIAARATENLV